MELSCLRLSTLASAAISGHGLVGKHTASLLRGAAQRSAIDRITLEATGESTGDQDHLTLCSCLAAPAAVILPLLSSSCLPVWITASLMSVCPNAHVPRPHFQQTIIQEGGWATMLGWQVLYPLNRPLSPQMLPLTCSPASACLFPSEVPQGAFMVNILQMKK